ncbi:hypothetical protein BCR34DRAFT_207628 [Clohesyomyces aquaticus]|uniref:Rhodopsin domain-containing protein n=1 Tax=Clohesyomyces aquaticus TaxID=1231657 RepID=A0A1Y2A9L6_9PLEO|nr:hypothetical protein BCR34DRAFT_207628 [Clohesyomyces aquaticus]
MASIDANTTPALEAHPGVISNLQNPYSLEPYVLATSVLCLTLATMATLARMFTKVYILKKVELEDYSLIVANATFAAFTGVLLAGTVEGAGTHQWNVSVAQFRKVVLYANVAEILYPPLMFAAKLAVLLQIQRIFTVHKKTFIYWAALILIAANFITYITIFFIFIFACHPREKIWMSHIAGQCLDVNGAIIATGAMNLVSDITILFLPLIGIMDLQMPSKRKIGVAAVFGTCALSIVSSIFRLIYSVRLARSNDVTWELAPVGMWALAECETVIMVACFPTFPRLFKYLLGEDKNTSKHSYPTEQKSNNDRNSAPLRALGNSPYQWQITTGTTSVGSYYPFEERARREGIASETKPELDPSVVHVLSQFSMI